LRVLYVCHPLSAPTRKGIDANRYNAQLWAVWIERTFGVAVSADWIWCTEILAETPENRAHGLQRDCARIERCDGVLLVGGRVSQGMRMESEHASWNAKPVLDLTGCGYEPPEPGSDREAAIVILVREWLQEQEIAA
jgi:hypothetical protein